MNWLSQEGPRALKHHGWRHPMATCLTHYAVVSLVTFGVHDHLLEVWQQQHTTLEDDPSQAGVAFCDGYSERRSSLKAIVITFLLIYSTWLLLWRLTFCEPREYRHCVLYEYCWLCNVTLVLSALALAWNRPIIAGAYCVTVGIDQILWYVDLAGFALTGRFPVGVIKYLFWKGTTWKTRITCTHHVWTIPLLLYTSSGIHVLAFPLSIVIMITNVLLSRWMIPSHCAGDSSAAANADNTSCSRSKYLNVNLSRALWKDISFPLLQIDHDCPPAHVYLFRLFWRWQAFDALVFVILYQSCQRIFGPAPAC
jgi:hypothetical protein